MKYSTNRPFADPDIAARKLVEIASTIEPVPICSRERGIGASVF
jgi:hypothetical protein